MKKLLFLGIATFLFSVVAIAQQPQDKVVMEELKGGYYKIVNDTDDKVKIHTGYGTTTLNPNGGSTSVRCETGKKVKVDGDVIFEVSSDMCGETVKLSEYM